jgi:hypothetical protein
MKNFLGQFPLPEMRLKMFYPIEPENLLTPADVVGVKIGPYMASETVKYAEKLIREGIASRRDIGAWGSAIEDVRKERKRIEKVMDFFLAPIKAAKAAVESARKQQADMFKPPIDFLQLLDDRLSEPYGAFLLKVKREDYAKAAAKQEQEAAAAAELAKQQTGSDFMAEIAAQEVLAEPVKTNTQKVKTSTGTTYTVFIDRVRIVDAAAVPRIFCKPDEELLLEKFKAGEITHVPGVEFWQEPSIRVR